MKILMIGADAVDNDCVRRITQEWGHQLEKAKTGKEALTLGAEKDYDLILLSKDRKAVKAARPNAKHWDDLRGEKGYRSDTRSKSSLKEEMPME